MKQEKLFDDTSYIDKSVLTSYDKVKWKKAFQNYCDSDEIREESAKDGLNACGYWFACDLCEGFESKTPCANALIEYLGKEHKEVDYRNTDIKYLDKLLRGDLSD